MFKVPEKFRKKGTGRYGSDASFGNNGAFEIRSVKLKGTFNVIASDGEGWEHVSVSQPHRTPSWNDMCVIKDLFWGSEDCVVQYHPPESAHVNTHQHCLHLWRPTQTKMPTPPSYMVGIKGLELV